MFLDFLVDALRPAEAARAITWSPWADYYTQTGGLPGYTTTYGTEKAEPIGDNFVDYVTGGLMGNTVVAAVERVRVSVFSQAQFVFQRYRKGIPGGLYSQPDLDLLKRPWVGGTTGDLLARALLDADFAGNSFWTLLDDEMVRMRPDWVELVLAERYDPDGRQVGWKRVGYLYHEGGKGLGNRPAVFLANEVAHFAPKPDPLATYRGMSWLTPIIREIQADTMATRHKLKFFENAATPNLSVALKEQMDPDTFERYVQIFDAQHKGLDKAYETLYTAGGADVTVIGADMKQLDFKTTQGAGETRIAADGGVHPAIVGLSEGMQGSSLNAGNFGAARRLVSDVTMSELWQNVAGSFEVLFAPAADSRLWYDASRVPFLREDAKDAAEITEIQARTVANLVKEGFTPESAVAAVLAQNMDLLVHSGMVSVQLQPPGGPAGRSEDEEQARALVEMIQKVYLGVDVVLSAEEARGLLNKAGAGLAGSLPVLPAPTANGNGNKPAALPAGT